MHSCILHVEHAYQDIIATEVEEAEAGGKEQQQYEEPDPAEEQELEANFANPNLQQGKHQFILTQCHTSVESLITYFNLCI